MQQLRQFKRWPLVGVALSLLCLAVVGVWMVSGRSVSPPTAAPTPHEMAPVSAEAEHLNEVIPPEIPADPQLTEQDRALRRETLENMRHNAAAAP